MEIPMAMETNGYLFQVFLMNGCYPRKLYRHIRDPIYRK